MNPSNTRETRGGNGQPTGSAARQKVRGSKWPGAPVATLRPSTLHMDGELVAMDRSGRPSFQILQAGALPSGWRFGYYAFDLLQQGSTCLGKRPLTERRTRLEDLVAGSAVKFSPALPGTADQVVNAVREHGLEGVVAKHCTPGGNVLRLLIIALEHPHARPVKKELRHD
jgi:ATP dependent DNA ligase domain